MKIGFQDQLSLTASQSIAECSNGEHSAILLTFIKLPFVTKIFCLFLSGSFTQVLMYVIFFFLKIDFVKANSADPDKMPYSGSSLFAKVSYFGMPCLQRAYIYLY